MNQSEKRDDANKRDGLDGQLESSFQTSFRSTSTHLKVYDPSASAGAGAHGTSAETNWAGSAGSGKGSERNKDQSKHNVSERSQLEPPAGRHAPHHSWLLGSHGGKKKPQAVRTRDGIPVQSAIDSATLAGLFSSGAASPAGAGAPASGGSPDAAATVKPQPLPPPGVVSPAAPAAPDNSPQARIGEHPDDYRIPPNAKGALPPESYEQPDLYAATVEVKNPAQPAAGPLCGAEQNLESEPFDETVAHLYSRTVDVNKPGKLTRFPEESLHPTANQPDAPKFGTTVPPGLPTEAAPQFKTPQSSGQKPGPAASGNLPPKLPPPRPLSQFQSGISHPAFKQPPNLPPGAATQFQSGQAHPQAPKSESKISGWSPYFESKASEEESAQSGKFTTVKKNQGQAPSSQTSSSSKNSPPPESPPVDRKQRTARDQDSTGSASDGKSGGQRKRLPSYVDRQIASADEQSSEENDQTIGNKKGSAGKTAAVVLATVVALGIAGAVAYESIKSGGSRWIPFVRSDQWKKWNTQAETAMSQGKYAEAIGYLNEAIKLDNEQAALYHRRGLSKLQLHKEDRNESALRDLDIAIKKDPKLFEALLDRAAVRIELGQFDQAMEDYDRLIKAGKDTDKVRFGRGLAKYYAGEYAEAEREFNNILKQNPNNVQAAIALGATLYASKSDKKGAAEQFTNAAKNDKSGLADRNLGILSYENGPGGYQDAKRFYNDAIDDTQTDANIYNERGVISWSLKNPLDATTDFRHAIGLDPTLEAAVRNLDFVGRSLIDVDPKSEVALLSQIEINLLKKNWAFAIISADKLIEVAGWKRAPAYDGVLLKWVALNLSGQADKSQEVLRDCKLNAGSFPWPMPLVRYLSGDNADFKKLEAEAFNLTQRTAAHYYAGMDDYFKKKPQEAKKKLEWVLEQGSPSSIEYPLAGKALEWLAPAGSAENSEK